MDNHYVQPTKISPQIKLEILSVLNQQITGYKTTAQNQPVSDLYQMGFSDPQDSPKRYSQIVIKDTHSIDDQPQQNKLVRHFPLVSIKSIFSKAIIEYSNLTEKQLGNILKRGSEKQVKPSGPPSDPDIIIVGNNQDSNVNLRSFYYLILLSIFSYPEDSTSEIKQDRQPNEIELNNYQTQILIANSCEKEIPQRKIAYPQSIHYERLKKLKMTIFSQNVDLTIVKNAPQLRFKEKDNQNNQLNQRNLTNSEYKRLLLEFINLLLKQCSSLPICNQDEDFMLSSQKAQAFQQQYKVIPHLRVLQTINKYTAIDVIFSMLIRAILYKRFQIEEAKDYRSFISDHTVYSCLCNIFQIQSISLQNDKCTVLEKFSIMTFSSTNEDKLNSNQLAAIRQQANAQDETFIQGGRKQQHQSERLLEDINKFDFDLDLENIKIPELDFSKASTTNTVSKIYFLTVPSADSKNQVCKFQYEVGQTLSKLETPNQKIKNIPKFFNPTVQGKISLKDLGSRRDEQISLRQTLKDDIRQTFKQKIVQLIKINEKPQAQSEFQQQSESEANQQSLENKQETWKKELRILIPSVSTVSQKNTQKINVSPQNGKQSSVNNPGSTTFDRSFGQLTPKSNSFSKSGTDIDPIKHKRVHSLFARSQQEIFTEENPRKDLHIQIPEKTKGQQYDQSNLNSERTAGFGQSNQNSQRFLPQRVKISDQEERVRSRKSYDNNFKRFIYKQFRVSSQEVEGCPQRVRSRKSQDIRARTPIRVPIKINYPKYINHQEFLRYGSPGGSAESLSKMNKCPTPTSLHSYYPESPSMSQLKAQFEESQKEKDQFIKFDVNKSHFELTFNKQKGHPNHFKQTYEDPKQNRHFNQRIRAEEYTNDNVLKIMNQRSKQKVQKIKIKNQGNQVFYQNANQNRSVGCLNSFKTKVFNEIPCRNLPIQSINRPIFGRINANAQVNRTLNVAPSVKNINSVTGFYPTHTERKTIKVSFNYINRPI